MSRNARTTAMIVEGIGSKMWANTGSPRAPMARLVIVPPSCMAAMKRFGLGGGGGGGRAGGVGGGAVRAVVGARAERCAAVPRVAQLGEGGAAGRDEAVFGRHEEGVQ